MPSTTTITTRWCPTPDQLMILEEMYKGGIRTPNASQIQHITAQLSHYGKIEGKNVFYWFQNHKARDRQKLRRKLMMSKQLHLHQQHLQNPNYQQMPLHHLLFHSYESPPSLALPKFSNYTSLGFLSQLGTGVGNGSTQVIDKSLSRMYGGDCMIMLDVDPTTPTSWKRPLKTLELFPIKTSTSLKDECSASKQNPTTNTMD